MLKRNCYYAWLPVLLSGMLFTLSAYGQTGGNATGIVNDENSHALLGVTVQAMVKDKIIKSATTDSLGRFKFSNLKAGDYNFVFNSVGYQSQTVTGYALKEGQTISMLIAMISTANNLGDVIVVGFGTQKKVDVTGSVTTVKMSEVLGDRPVINVGAALQGAVPGLLVSGNNQVGQTKNLQIRGAYTVGTQNSDGSYGGAVAPLILIDNVPGDLNMFNPDDIETISVLKDAASTAIYGARGAYGVVLITTKKPKNGFRTIINYNNNISTQHAINLPKQAALTDYFRMYKEAGYGSNYWADGQNIDNWLQYLDQYKKDPSSLNIVGDGIYKAADGKAYYLRERDPYAQMVENSFMQSHNLSISGASDKIRYRLSAGLTAQNGPIVSDKDKYNRTNIAAFLSTDVTSWFTQEADIMYAASKKTLPGIETQGGLFTLRLLSYTPEGSIPADVFGLGADYPMNTPLNTIKYGGLPTTNTANPRVFTKSIIKPFKGFEAVLEYTYNKSDVRYDYYTGKQAYTSVQKSVSIFPSIDVLTKEHSFTNYSAVNIYGSYNKTIGAHYFKLMAGFNKESSYYEDLWVQAKNQTSTAVPSLGGATGDKNPVDSYSEYAITGGFFRLNYNYKNKYLLEANGRYDGSSKFPTGHRYGFFPSVSVGWNINQESFLRSTKWLNELKVRGSWGSIGNQNIDPYKFYPSMSVSTWTASAINWLNNGAQVTTIGLPALVSSNFTWETVKSTNIGLDFTVLKSHLSGSFDWYKRNTTGMLAPGFQLPGVVGTGAPFQNTADMQVKGWELALNWRDKIGNVAYRIGVNLSDYSSEITNYNNVNKILGTGTQAYYAGQKLGDIWGYVSDGFYTIDDFVNTTTWQLKPGVTAIQGYNTVLRPGDLKFKNLSDVDGTTNTITSGANTANDPGDRKIIGNTTPRYQYGAMLGANYKGFDLSVMLQGVGKRDYWLGNSAYFPFTGNDIYTPVFYNQLDYWKPKDAANGDYTAVNPNASLPRIYNINGSSAPGSNTRVSDKYLSSAAYMRIKNVTLSYSLPSVWLRKAHLAAFRIFVSVENLATFSSLPKGFDPETLNWTYPAYRTTSFGVSLTL
ncbi:MAG: TonB-dependent receptor [Filimonas sp.]|nr:TonB-dependent receptor [Filimonas sp.]